MYSLFGNCFVQAFLMFETLNGGIGFQYITGWVLLSNLGMLIYYYGGSLGKWPYLWNLALDYFMMSFLLYLAPVFLVLVGVLVCDYQSSSIIDSLQGHQEILWIKESRFFFLPRVFSQDKAETAVYIFALSKYVSILSGGLSVFFLLPLSKGWKVIFARSKPPNIGLYFAFLSMLVLTLMNTTEVGRDGIDKVFIPVSTAAMMPLVISAVIGFFRYWFSLKVKSSA